MARDYCIGSRYWPGLSKLTEESGEMLQVIGKIVGNEGRPGHWDGSFLPDRLIEEMGDTMAAMIFVSSHNSSVPWAEVMKRCEGKLALFEKWHSDTLKSVGPPGPSNPPSHNPVG